MAETKDKYTLTTLRPKDDREVREKLLVKGPEGLTDAELLSIVLKDSSAPGSNLSHSVLLLQSFDNNLGQLASADLQRLRVTAKTGIKRAAVLACVFELGRRAVQGSPAGVKTINTPADVRALLGDRLDRLQYEEFWVIYLTTANTVLDKLKVGQGGVSGVMVDHKLIVKRAVELLASSVILVHNHPSGVARPSEEDLHLTTRIKEAASLFDIAVLDHIVFTSTDTFSFRANALL